MKICVPIVGPSANEAEQQLRRAVEVADMIELRFDLIEPVAKSRVAQWQQRFDIPMIFKSPPQELLALRPAYVDSERPIEVPRGTRLILSSHDRLKSFAEFPPADLHKLAITVDSTLDALRLAREVRKSDARIGVAMGEDGLSSRVLAGPWTYASLEPQLASAPGQLTVAQMRDIYHVRRLGPQSPVYGLLGNPVAHSLGHYVHNVWLEEGVYLPIRLEEHELGEALDLLRQLNLGGLSVTMPFKEAILPYLDRIETASGAVNTVCVEGDQLVGHNTDGPAVCKLLNPAPGAHVVILGAGGAARGVAYALHARGVHLTILNRTIERAEELAQELGAEAGRLVSPLPICDYVVQTTPCGMVWETVGSPIVLEMVAQKRTQAHISGRAVWLEQAMLQRELWQASRLSLVK